MEDRDLEVLGWRLFEESNDAVFVLDSETATIQQANPAAQRLTALRWRHLRGRRLDELIHSEQDRQMTKLLSAVRETGFFHSQEEYLLVRHELVPLPINITVSRIHAPSGQLGLVVARDVSERRQAERALRQFSEELRRQVLQQTEELRVANQRLSSEIEERRAAEQALENTNQRLREAIGQLECAQEQAIRRERLHALEQIAGGIAHDVNNALSAVTAFSELILEKELDSETREWAVGVRTAAQDIAGIVWRLRQFYGDPADRQVGERIELVAIAKQAVHLTRPKWRDESLRLQKEITVSLSPEAAPKIIGDASALRSVLTNLILNAVDAVEKAGQITVRIAEASSMAVVEIHDDGRGMTEEESRRCLEPFYTTKTEGTGLGLSVCHGIVKGHGGRIEIDSTPGRGTTVRLLIPTPTTSEALLCPRESELAATDDRLRLLRGKRLLYIDDNELARKSTAALLESLGLSVDTASDAVSGMTMFRAQCYDAVITDMSMPGMDGRQLTARIKLLRPTIPVVLISGWSLTDSGSETAIAQPDSVLSKPVRSDQLAAILLELLT